MKPARAQVQSVTTAREALDDDIECSRCGALLLVDDVGYSGPEDRTADKNDASQFMEIVCKQCDRKPAHYSFVGSDDV